MCGENRHGSEEKMIEEMADDVRRIRESYFGQADYLFAMKLYEDGYRKQSEGDWTYGDNDTMKCTLCRRRMPKIISARFCPNCGAKMGGGAE